MSSAVRATVRAAVPADLEAVAAIYDHEVLHSIATFDTAPQGVALWEPRLSPGPGLHLLVAVDGDLVVGYAYSARYRPRPAYEQTREVSVYLDASARGRGVGRLLYDELLPRLAADGIHTALAVIAQPNDASDALHAACGFERIGLLPEVGHKFGRWVGTALWAKVLG